MSSSPEHSISHPKKLFIHQKWGEGAIIAKKSRRWNYSWEEFRAPVFPGDRKVRPKKYLKNHRNYKKWSLFPKNNSWEILRANKKNLVGRSPPGRFIPFRKPLVVGGGLDRRCDGSSSSSTKRWPRGRERERRREWSNTLLPCFDSEESGDQNSHSVLKWQVG